MTNCIVFRNEHNKIAISFFSSQIIMKPNLVKTLNKYQTTIKYEFKIFNTMHEQMFGAWVNNRMLNNYYRVQSNLFENSHQGIQFLLLCFITQPIIVNFVPGIIMYLSDNIKKKVS